MYIYIYIYIYIYGRLYNTGGLGQFADLRGVLAKKGVGVFEGGWYPNARYEKLNHTFTGFFLGVKL